VDVSIKTYFKYMFYNKKYIFILFTLSLFFLAEGINTAFFRILSKYDDVVSGDYNIAFPLYWMTLGILQLGFFIVLVVKYFCINFICLKSNELLHNNMLISLLRSPTGYFDTVPTGRLINRFSNDLSLMDTTLAYTLIDNI
jgi:ABC-type multidrug transport system fused ATPase/permease subunit